MNMPDIKIDEEKYFIFLNTVKSYVEKTSIFDLQETTKNDGTWLKSFIEEEFKIRELMLARRTYYDFYVKVREKNKEAANEAYQKYIEAKLEIERLRKETKNGK